MNILSHTYFCKMSSSVNFNRITKLAEKKCQSKKKKKKKKKKKDLFIFLDIFYT